MNGIVYWIPERVIDLLRFLFSSETVQAAEASYSVRIIGCAVDRRQQFFVQQIRHSKTERKIRFCAFWLLEKP